MVCHFVAVDGGRASHKKTWNMMDIKNTHCLGWLLVSSALLSLAMEEKVCFFCKVNAVLESGRCEPESSM